MVPLRAELSIETQPFDQRRASRRTLKLEVPSSTANFATKALIHDLSEAGLLIETTVELRVGDIIQVELPHAGATEARVVRGSGSLFGCEFISTLRKAAVSATLLRAPVERPELLSPLWNLPARSADGNRAEATWDIPYVSSDYSAAATISLCLLALPLALFLYALAALPIST